jgi:pimeloyl-ACP methyl ester carboxylesterase
MKAENNIWHHYEPSATVFIFLHGIFSSSRTCWTGATAGVSTRPVSWPDLVVQDQRLGSSAVFLSGYSTSVTSGDLKVRNCAREIFDGLRLVDSDGRRPAFDHENLIFIAHSTGGIAVRCMLERFREAFHGKNVGLLLIASPSLGSVYANKLELLARFYNQQLGLQLRWGGESLDDLDGRFKDLVHDHTRRPFNLFGRECYEHYFILRKRWLPAWFEKLLPNRRKLVDRLSAGRYFDEPRLPADTDHFTSVKPAGLEHPAHKQLVLFKQDFDEWLSTVGRVQVAQAQTLAINAPSLGEGTRPPIRVVFPKIVEYPNVKFSITNESETPIQITGLHVVVAAKAADNHSGAEYFTGIRTQLEFNINTVGEGDIRELLGQRVVTLGPKEAESFSLNLFIDNALALLMSSALRRSGTSLLRATLTKCLCTRRSESQVEQCGPGVRW